MQSCCKDQICMSLSYLSHRAQSVKNTCRIILSWYIEVAADHEIFDISESDTWSELSAVHQDLVFDFSSLLSLHNLFKTSFYLFSVIVQITDLDFISDVLMKKLQWNNSTVLQDLVLLFGSNNNVWNNYIKIWQDETQRIIQEKWIQVEYLKCVIFQKKFFFYCWEHHLSHSNSDNSSSNLLNNEISIVAKSENEWSVNHYWEEVSVCLQKHRIK